MFFLFSEICIYGDMEMWNNFGRIIIIAFLRLSMGVFCASTMTNFASAAADHHKDGSSDGSSEDSSEGSSEGSSGHGKKKDEHGH